MSEQPLEGVVMPSISNQDASPPKLSREENKRGVKNINVTRRVAELGVDPIQVLALIAAGDSDGLNVEEDVRVFERRAAASELLSYMVPKLKAKEHVDTEEEFKPILEYAPKRGEQAQRRLDALGDIDDDD